jgi:hypothetical protein
MILIGALQLLSGGVDCPATIEAEQVCPRGEKATASTLLAEARVSLLGTTCAGRRARATTTQRASSLMRVQQGREARGGQWLIPLDFADPLVYPRSTLT